VTCAVLIPSLDRPHRLEETISHLHRNTAEAHRLLFCVSDEESKRALDWLGEWYLDDSDDDDHRYVTRMNKLVRHIGDAETVFFGSDDVIHHPGWLTEALKVLERFSCVVVNDGHNPNGTQALVRADYLDRAVFDAPGDAFHHGYLHNFADNEQHFTAYKRNEYARAMESHVEHLHPLFQSHNAIPWDSTYTNAQRGWDHDAALFHERAQVIDQAL
jgi:hypothetical protein